MKSNRRMLITGLFFLSLLALFVIRVFSHCEIPCGIYDDEMRFRMISENISTVEKSMKQIMELSKQEPQNLNQIVRWVQNKENHAEDISHIVTQYFMTQRIKPVDERDSRKFREYVNKLTLLHQIMFQAMKSKQTTELDHVEKLRSLLADFRAAYSGEITIDTNRPSGGEL